MADNSVLSSLENVWHYGLPTSPPLHTTSSVGTPPPCLTSSSSNPLANRESSSVSNQVGFDLRSLFSVMDEDGDGRLSLCEMRSLLAKLHISSDQSPALDSFVEQYSSSTHDDDLFLDFPQFTQLYVSLFGAPPHEYFSTQVSAQCEDDDCFEDDLLDAFRVYDKNHDGFISPAELAAVLVELGMLPDRCGINSHVGRCQAYIDSVDLNGDGMIDLHEFTCMITYNHRLDSVVLSSLTCN